MKQDSREEQTKKKQFGEYSDFTSLIGTQDNKTEHML